MTQASLSRRWEQGHISVSSVCGLVVVIIVENEVSVVDVGIWYVGRAVILAFVAVVR